MLNESGSSVNESLFLNFNISVKMLAFLFKADLKAKKLAKFNNLLILHFKFHGKVLHKRRRMTVF